jgi:hypothetical protein
MYTERGTSLYILYSSSLYLILHTPLEWLAPNIYRRIFGSKESILFAAPWERVHTSLPYINILRISMLYSVTRTLQLIGAKSPTAYTIGELGLTNATKETSYIVFTELIEGT